MKQILFVGPEVTDFLNPLAKKLKDSGYTVDLMENRRIPRNHKEISESYSNIINYNEITGKKITLLMAFRYLLKFEFCKKFIKTIFFNCLDNRCSFIKSVRNTISYQNSREIFSALFDKYDILNFHSLSTGNLSFVDYTKPHNKIILSFWGSDLFQIWGNNDCQISGVRDYYTELNALKRADIITLHSYEMERVVMAKFGAGMQKKIIRTLFGSQDEKFDRIDKKKEAGPDINFLKKYKVSLNKMSVTIGYCADPICNHLLIINELGKIDIVTKEKIHLLVPMTYGNVPAGYMDEVKIKLDESGISYTLFDRFLPLDELLDLRITSDIMVMMNKSDALSASVSESIYAGNLLISAFWLPYSPYRSGNIYFHETDFEQLSNKITYAVNNPDKVKPNLIDNPAKVKKLTAFSQNCPVWLSIFK